MKSTLQSEGSERRQRVAHGVSRGYRRAKHASPGRAAENFARVVTSSRSVAPAGAWITCDLYPTAHALSYDLTPLRGWEMRPLRGFAFATSISGIAA